MARVVSGKQIAAHDRAAERARQKDIERLLKSGRPTQDRAHTRAVQAAIRASYRPPKGGRH